MVWDSPQSAHDPAKAASPRSPIHRACKGSHRSPHPHTPHADRSRDPQSSRQSSAARGPANAASASRDIQAAGASPHQSSTVLSFARLAGEITASVAPALQRLSNFHRTQNACPLQMISAGPVSIICALFAGHTTRLRAAFCNSRQLAVRIAQCNRSRRARARPGARRSRRPAAALEDPKLNLVRRPHPHELHVRPMRKQRAACDLRAQFLPAQAMRAEVIALQKQNKMWDSRHSPSRPAPRPRRRRRSFAASHAARPSRSRW